MASFGNAPSGAPDLEARIARIERRSRVFLIVGAVATLLSCVALAVGIEALRPWLSLASALNPSAVNSAGAVQLQGMGVSAAPAHGRGIGTGPKTPTKSRTVPVVTVSVERKRFIPADPDAERFSDRVELVLLGDNHTTHTIRAYEGTLIARDLLGNRIISLQVRTQQPLAPGTTHKFDEYFEINQFVNSQTTFAATKLANLQFDWRLDKVLFANGRVKKSEK